MQIELKSELINPVGTATTYPFWYNNPLLVFYGYIRFLGTALLWAPRMISILFLEIAARLTRRGDQFKTIGV